MRLWRERGVRRVELVSYSLTRVQVSHLRTIGVSEAVWSRGGVAVLAMAVGARHVSIVARMEIGPTMLRAWGKWPKSIA